MGDALLHTRCSALVLSVGELLHTLNRDISGTDAATNSLRMEMIARLKLKRMDRRAGRKGTSALA